MKKKSAYKINVNSFTYSLILLRLIIEFILKIKLYYIYILINKSYNI